jgi:pantetheine-phosphate adenylyltransferase
MKTAIYPGSFDPVTNGHVNLIRRAATIFNPLVVAVACNVRKSESFTREERLEMLREVTEGIEGVVVDSFDGLLVDYMARLGSSIVVRGLRAVSDFEFEFQMAHMNHKLLPELETIFMVTGAEEFFISSSVVREVAALGGNVDGLVPGSVADRLRRRFPQR